MTFYTASFSFQDTNALPDIRERSTDIRFRREDDSHRLAALNAVSWYNNRHKAFPECFPELWCLKLYLLHIPLILPDGSLSFHENGGCVFEWKYDWGGTIEDYIEARLRR
jgi:hypothetical protein